MTVIQSLMMVPTYLVILVTGDHTGSVSECILKYLSPIFND